MLRMEGKEIAPPPHYARANPIAPTRLSVPSCNAIGHQFSLLISQQIFLFFSSWQLIHTLIKFCNFIPSDLRLFIMNIVEASSTSKRRHLRAHLALSLAFTRKYLSAGLVGRKEDIGRSVRIAVGPTRLIIVHEQCIVSAFDEL
jgi:hypothetical protein